MSYSKIKNMKVYLVRHGETDWNKNNILIGQFDIPLNAEGKNQAAEIAQKLEGTNFDCCYASPLSRAKETAEIICQNKIKIIEDDLLKERDCGIYSGKNKHEIDWIEYDNASSVESNKELFMRAKKFAEKLEQNNMQNVLVVSHSGLLKNLLHILKGEDFQTFDWGLYDNEFKDNCSFVEIEKC